MGARENGSDPRCGGLAKQACRAAACKLWRRRDRARRGTKTGRLLILKSGAVGIFKGDVEFAQVAEPGAVFGELSALLDAPHSADIRTLEASEFHVADAAALLQDPTALLYVTTVLARRIDAANQGLLQLKILLEAGEPRSLIDKTLDGIEGLLSAIGTGYIRAGAGHSIFPSA